MTTTPQKFLIYCAESPSGKKYIGLTSRTFNLRIREHYFTAHWKYQHSQKLRTIEKAILKYGKTLKWSVVEENIETLELLNLREKFYIAQWNTHQNGYNETSGGEGTLGRTKEFMPKEELEKRSSSAKNKKLTNEQKKNIGSSLKKAYLEGRKKITTTFVAGMVMDPEVVKRSAEKRKGYKPSAQTLKKLSESHKGNKHSEKTKAKMSNRKHSKEEIEKRAQSLKKSYKQGKRKANQVQCSNGQTFYCVKEAAEILKLDYSNLSQAIKEKRLCRGLMFYPIKEKNDNI